MKPRTNRALLVLAVFALQAILSAASGYVSGAGKPAVAATPFDTCGVFLREFRYYLSWALVAPGIFWLGRKVTLRRRRWFPPLAFHLAIPVAGALPFWGGLLLLDAAFGAGFPPFQTWTTIQWELLFARHALMVLPIYGLLLGLGAAVQVSRDRTANEMRAVALQRSLAAAQLDGLRMKAQPHFLVETLNSVAALARTGDTDAVVRVVDRLGTLLRLSMETSGRQVVRLEEELELLDKYLAIEEIRFKDRLRIVRRVGPDVQNALVPNLILQPLVESALLGGRAGRLDAGLLEIAAHRDGDTLCIAMRDDGPGLPPDWSLASSAGSGLRNVVERLEGLYAGRSRFELTNDASGGTRVLLSLPFSETQSPVA